MIHLSTNFLARLPTIPVFVCLGVPVGQIYDHTILINFSSGPLGVFSLGIAICTKVLNILISLLVASTYHVMSSLMNQFFPFASLNSIVGARYHSDVLLLPSPNTGDNRFTIVTNENTMSVLLVAPPPVQLQQIIPLVAPVQDLVQANQETLVPSSPMIGAVQTPEHVPSSLFVHDTGARTPSAPIAASGPVVGPVASSTPMKAERIYIDLCACHNLCAAFCLPLGRIHLGACAGIFYGSST
jgi:hypothetical protein